jgi:hypothetical protein
VWNLGSRERDDFNARIVPVEHVEVVKVAAGGSQYDDAFSLHKASG